MLLGFPTTDSQGEAHVLFSIGGVSGAESKLSCALLMCSSLLPPSWGPPRLSATMMPACQSSSARCRNAARPEPTSLEPVTPAVGISARANHAAFCAVKLSCASCHPCAAIGAYIHPSACARISASSPLPGHVRKFEMEGGRMAISCAAGELGGMQILIGAVNAVSANQSRGIK